MFKRLKKWLKKNVTYFIGIFFSLLIFFLIVSDNQSLKYLIVYILGAIVSATLVYIDRKY